MMNDGGKKMTKKRVKYMDSAGPVMRAIENVKRDIRKVCCDSDEKGCDIVLIMENMQAEKIHVCRYCRPR